MSPAGLFAWDGPAGAAAAYAADVAPFQRRGPRFGGRNGRARVDRAQTATFHEKRPGFPGGRSATRPSGHGFPGVCPSNAERDNPETFPQHGDRRAAHEAGTTLAKWVRVTVS